MATPQFIEEANLTLVETKAILDDISKRDEEMSYLSNKAKEYLENFVTLKEETRAELHKKLLDLNLTRLKEEHIVKIIDFLPKTVNDLKVVLQAYPLSMPKKDQDAIVAVVKDVA